MNRLLIESSSFFQGTNVPSLRKYQGPILNNLEVIEISLGSKWDIQDLRHFLRFLPNVKSIYLQLDKPPIKALPRARKLFSQVENLVLEMSTERVSNS